MRRDPLHEYWAAFVQAIRDELTAHGRDPNILRADSTSLKVYLPLAGGAYHMETFDAKSVFAGDAHEMAARVYRRYQQAEKDEGRAPA